MSVLALKPQHVCRIPWVRHLLVGMFPVLIFSQVVDADTQSGAGFAPLVTVVPVENVDVSPRITRHATVKPRTERKLFAPVSGQIVWVSDQIDPGHLQKPGDQLATIDKIPFESAVAEAEAALAESELNLLLEERSAKLERARRAGTEVSASAPLVLREPYVRAARLRRDADKAALDQARADLSKLNILAPFQSMITSHKLFPDAYVTAGETLADIISAGDLIIDLSLTREEWGQLLPHGPGNTSDFPISGEVITDRGTRIKVIPERVLAAADDFTKQPVLRLRVDLPEAQIQSLLPGAFVTITLRSDLRRTLQKTPVSALTFDNRIWYVLPDENRLRNTDISQAFEHEGYSYLPKGSLPENAQVLISPLASYETGTVVTPEGRNDG